VSVGVAAGLLFGKTFGVLGAAYLAVKLRLGKLPALTTWHHMAGMGMLAGIGFTVALFVSALSFEDPGRAAAAKIGIFAASLVAGILGFVWLRFLGPDMDELDQDHDRILDARESRRP
jgi:NhaA family Na+:H+ antiporter